MKLGESDLQAVLGRVAELARQTLPGVAGASVTLVESDRAFTAAFAGQLALDLDETQYQEGFGPCLEVAQSAGSVTVPDMAAEIRWPAFARQALAAGVHSSLSVALPLQEAVLGALNIYAIQPAIFDRDAIELARTFAGYAAVAIANARLYQTTATLAEDMRRAMETRAVIEQAKGILVAQQHCTPEQAFELLTRLSQTTHRKLRDCAADLVTSTAEDRPRLVTAATSSACCSRPAVPQRREHSARPGSNECRYHHRRRGASAATAKSRLSSAAGRAARSPVRRRCLGARCSLPGVSGGIRVWSAWRTAS